MKVIMFFVIVVFLSSGVFAISGVNPRSYEIDFVPNYEGDFDFDFVIDGNSKVDLYVEGDLAEYVSLDKEKISGRESVVASLRLPSKIDSPGINQIRIVAWNVVSVIKVNVPYPEKYVELRLSAPNANIGDTIDINLEVSSKGNESVVVEAKIEIYKTGDWESDFTQDRELVEVMKSDSSEIAVNESEIFEWVIGSNYSMGDYLVVAIVNYGDEVVQVENPFRVGSSLVRILNYTREFRENKIDKFEIEVESLSNDNIDDLYAEINIIGLEETKFVTPVTGLKKWRAITLSGFLDTTEILGDDIEVEIVLYYNGKSSSQIVELKILKGFDYVSFVVVFVGLIIIGLSIWKGKVFIKKYREYRE